MRQVIILLLVIYAKENYAQNGKDFVLDSVDMTDEVFDQCSHCDERSDRAGSRAVADALREYMSRNHINILLEQGKFLGQYIEEEIVFDNLYLNNNNRFITKTIHINF